MAKKTKELEDKPIARGEQLRQRAKVTKKRDRFVRTKMWMSTIFAMLYNDRGTIPPNIGNNIMVGNNMYITKYSLSAIFVIKELSEETPVAFVSDLVNTVKSNVQDVIVDVTIKNTPYYIDTKDKGLLNRVGTWQRILDNPTTSVYQARRAARQLYTVDVLKAGTKCYKSRIFVTVRAANGQTLHAGVKAVQEYLAPIAVFKQVKNDIQPYLDYMTMMSDKVTKSTKDIPTNLMSIDTLADIAPMTQGLNDASGTLMGMVRENMSPYYINFRLSANAKNIYLAAKSGFGKTFEVLGILLDMFADGYNLCIMDIKGNEFSALTQACGGSVLSMRYTSTYYVNTFVFREEEAIGYPDVSVYYDSMFKLSKEVMNIIFDLKEDDRSRGESLAEEFLTSVYRQLGVIRDNVNTWDRSEKLNPYKIYDYFTKYMSIEIRNKYGEIAGTCLDRLYIYFCRTGSNSHMFRDEYHYAEILDSKVLTFDFGILEDSTVIDPVVFHLKVMYMTLLNDEYVSYKKSLGEWTVKVLEESQVVDDYVLNIYKKEVTLRRAQNQVTILLGNSIAALADNKVAKPILESMNIFILGVLNSSSQRYLVNEFDLGDENKAKLEKIASDTDYMHTFLIVNRMQKNPTTALIKAHVPDRVRDGKIFKMVDVVKEEEDADYVEE